MHPLNANRNSGDFLPSLGDDSLSRIQNGLNRAALRRQAKREPMQKTASKEETPIIRSPMTIKIASINEIPETYERIGTGFYRQGHHLCP